MSICQCLLCICDGHMFASCGCVSFVAFYWLFLCHLWSAFTTCAWTCRSFQSSFVCLNQSKLGLWLFLTGSPLTKCFWIGTCQFWLLFSGMDGFGLNLSSNRGRTCAISGAVVRVKSKALICLSGMVLHRARFFWITLLKWSSKRRDGGCMWVGCEVWDLLVQGPWLCCALGCPAAGVGGRGEKRRTGYPAHLFTFCFQEALIKLWFFWNAEMEGGKRHLKLSQDRKMFPAQLSFRFTHGNLSLIFFL